MNHAVQQNDEVLRLQQRIKELVQEKAELEAFNYMVAHDLYAPLMRIEGYSEILLKDYAAALDSSGEVYLGRVVRAAQEAKRLLNDLLNLARATHSELIKKNVDMGLIAREILDDYIEGEPSRRVEITVSQGLIACADPVLVRLVLMNLLDNAWKYTSSREGAWIEVGASEEGVYYVRDNGIGFKSEFAKQLFMPFQRFCREEDFDGGGVGLAIVDRVIARHGGKVWAEGDGGATFFFSLPVS